MANREVLLPVPLPVPLCTLHTSQVVHVPLGQEVAQGVFLSTRWHHAGAWILAVPELVPSGNKFLRQHSGGAQSGISLSEGGDRKAICLVTESR